MSVGSQRLTTDGVIGVSGKPVRIYNVEMLNDASVGELVIRDGTTDSGTIYIKKNGVVIADTDTFNWEGGFFFPNGAFFDKDANTVAVVVNFEQVQS